MKLERCVAETPLTREPDMISPWVVLSDFIGQAAAWMDGILGFVKLKDLSGFFKGSQIRESKVMSNKLHFSY